MISGIVIVTVFAAIYGGFGYLAATNGVDSRPTDGRPNW